MVRQSMSGVVVASSENFSARKPSFSGPTKSNNWTSSHVSAGHRHLLCGRRWSVCHSSTRLRWRNNTDAPSARSSSFFLHFLDFHPVSIPFKLFSFWIHSSISISILNNSQYFNTNISDLVLFLVLCIVILVLNVLFIYMILTVQPATNAHAWFIK